MPALNFPSNPDVNQQYTANNKTYQWTGTSWVMLPPTTEVDPALMMLYASLL